MKKETNWTLRSLPCGSQVVLVEKCVLQEFTRVHFALQSKIQKVQVYSFLMQFLVELIDNFIIQKSII